MSLQCAGCGGNIFNGHSATELSFVEDGLSLHLVMSLGNVGRPGMGFILKDIPEDKRISKSNPFASVSHVLCHNRTRGTKLCNKKVGGVKFYPPYTDNMLIFFGHKALFVNNVKCENWKVTRSNALRDVTLIPEFSQDKTMQSKLKSRPPLVPHVTLLESVEANRALITGAGMTKTFPRPYQRELFRSVIECKRNSLVYLPTGLGKTLVACMVLEAILRLNPGRQAFFLVETNALAMQQVMHLQNENAGRSVVMMVGSSLSGLNSNCIQARLNHYRAADVVVATAGTFENMMLKHYIDPDSICCVVLDEAHHCDKEHPFNRVAKAFLTPGVGCGPAPAFKPPKHFPKVVALTASPAGEKTVDKTARRIAELLDRLGADLAAPIATLQQVKDRTPRVDLVLVSVSPTAAEESLLSCLEELVLRLVLDMAPPSSDIAVQVQYLLTKAIERTSGHGGREATTRADESWRFPNKAFMALCQQAAAVSSGRDSVRDFSDTSERSEGSEYSGGLSQLSKLMNVCFAVDEMGGNVTWHWVLNALGEMLQETGEREGCRLEAIRLVEETLARSTNRDGIGGERQIDETMGSKLQEMARLLLEHEQECSESGLEFKVLIFVSTRDLAMAMPEMLKSMPSIKSFVRPQAIVGRSEMTLSAQRASLNLLRTDVANVLVSTSVCGEGIDLPACALVLCASLPSSGTALVQVRGRIRCVESNRFVGLTRAYKSEDQEHVRNICLRESNMLAAIERLSLSAGTASRSSEWTPNTGPSSAPSVPDASVAPVLSGSTWGMKEVIAQLPTAAPTALALPTKAQLAQQEVRGRTIEVPQALGGNLSTPGSAGRDCTQQPETFQAGMFPVGSNSAQRVGWAPAKMRPPAARQSPSEEGHGGVWTAEAGQEPWKIILGQPLNPAAHENVARDLSNSIREALRKNPNQMARSILNDTSQKGSDGIDNSYDERKLPGPAHAPVFEARCIMAATVDGFTGLILHREAMGSSIKAAREAAAKKVVQHFLE